VKGLKKRRRIQIIALAAASLFVATAIVAYTLREGIQFFRTPTQVAENPPPPGEVFRIGGLVEEGSLVRGEGTKISFRVTDTHAAVAVTYEGILPDLFGEGEGMVGTGRMVNGTFEASEILARHDETYMPAEVIDALKEQGVYVDPGAENGVPTTN
jgi:cytochrome c-type biogenesis protein CcmE